MVPLESTLVNREETYAQVRAYMNDHQFTLGGNWDYDHGCFDRYLDEGHKVWLRIPFQVTHGKLDGDSDSRDTVIQLGTPFVLKHLYNEGNDKEARIMTYGGLINQFQEPVDKDAEVEDEWVSKARALLQQVERGWGG